MRESPQETLSRLGPYPRYPDFCTIQVDQRKGGFDPVPRRIERGTIDLQSDINCLPERSLLGAFGKQHDDYDHDVFNSAGSTLATPHFGPENGVHLRHTALSAPDAVGWARRRLRLETKIGAVARVPIGRRGSSM